MVDQDGQHVNMVKHDKLVTKMINDGFIDG